MFEDFLPYDDAEPVGVELPKISLTLEELKAIDSKLDLKSSSTEILYSLAQKGFEERGLLKKPNIQAYSERMAQELKTFDELGFSDYILLNWDILNYCHAHGIPVGNGRGSAAGSLVLYLLRVTNVDPLPNNLFFERFVSKTRAKKVHDKNGKEFLVGDLLPDVDSDISYDERKKVISYIEQKHSGRTAKILTFNTFSSKLCIREAVKYFYEVGEEEASVASDLIPKLHGKVASLKDALQDNIPFSEWVRKYPLAYENSLKIEDLNKNTGVHPSGIAICSQPIGNVVPLQKTKDGDLVTGYDMHDVADLMVKFDILGLRTLTIAHNTCLKLGLSLDDINPEDPYIYDVLQDFRHPVGLFQISADTNFRVCQDVKPDCLEELSDVVALARPSSLQFLHDYIEQKKNSAPMGLSPEFDAILASTKNVALFQEQGMQAANQVFGFSLEEAETLRRIVGKKLVDQIPAWKGKIYKAAEEKGLDVRVADYFWKFVEASASYGFNRCLAQDSVIETRNGPKCLFEVEKGEEILAFNTYWGEDHFVEIVDKMESVAEIYEVEMADGRKISCSMQHKFLCEDFKMRSLEEIIRDSHGIVCKD